MPNSNTCPACNHRFSEPTKYEKKLFCPHCHIQLFVESTHKIQNKSTPKLSFQKEIIDALSNSFLWALLAIPIYYLLEKLGLLQVINENFNKSMIIFLLVAFVFIAWDIFKSTKMAKHSKSYTKGVDTLSDYQNDGCEYKIIRDEPVHKLQCNQCQSHRMVDLFWFKRILSKTEKSIANIDVAEENFVGCLKCHSRYEIQISKNNKKEVTLYLCAFIFPVLLLFVYQLVLKQLLQVELYQSLTIYFLFSWIYIFLHQLIKINTKDNKISLRKTT